MLFYPIQESGGGGTSRPGLLGYAYLQRDSDLAIPNKEYNPFLVGCSYKFSEGDVGSLDASTGRITLPEGCKIIRTTINQTSSGLSGGRYMRTATEDTSSVGMGIFFCDNAGIFGVSQIETRNSKWAEMMFYHTNGSTYVLDSDQDDTKFIGMVEFFG